MTTTIPYTYVIDGTERHGEYIGDAIAAIDRAVEYLGATLERGVATWYDAASGETVTCEAHQLASLGAALLEQPSADVYSIWCAETI